ncbi:hypothetical protein PQ478_08865 [Alkalihalophilus pseudofirmus]|uniref:hypothetical protein n=1 Tax=Alkalihalophilus pseudofirmus TaxID=79885 RepID=UPI00259B8E5D|nr:hypothetical protein [Alkalihalophilus pseudofirmus]WEG18581.1 hypothetical protein PQ478_08865 [Alkalihalophilus pseudofirmus]
MNLNDLLSITEEIKQSESIELVFENCESISIPISWFNKLKLGNMEQQDEKDSYITDSLDMTIQLSSLDELTYSPSDPHEVLGMFIGNETCNDVGERPNILGRIINYHDIVVLYFAYGKGNRFRSVYVPWGDDQYNNEYMKVDIDEEKMTLNVFIKDDKNV